MEMKEGLGTEPLIMLCQKSELTSFKTVASGTWLIRGMISAVGENYK